MSPEQDKLAGRPVDGGEAAIRKETPVEVVGKWLSEFTETGCLGEIDRGVLRLALEGVGADFAFLDDEGNRRSLKKYTNASKADAMGAAWGERFGDFKVWVDNVYIPDHESNTGRELPKLDQSGRKSSGMRAFFGELTQIAGLGETDLAFNTIKERLETRYQNGKAWEDGKPEDRRRLIVPTSNGKPILISSFPPDFPLKAWEWLNSPRAQEDLTT